jgi:hypothetical protein
MRHAISLLLLSFCSTGAALADFTGRVIKVSDRADRRRSYANE